MEYGTHFVHRPGMHVLVATCELNGEALTACAERLAHDARDAGLHCTALPFIQLYGALAAVVAQPVASVPGDCALESAEIAGGWVVRAEGIPFTEARAASRFLRSATAPFWTSAGPAEFHIQAPGVGPGAVVIPVSPIGERVAAPLPFESARMLETSIPGA